MKPILYSTVEVLTGVPFSFTVEFPVLLSTYTNFLAVVYAHDGDTEPILCSLTKIAATGYVIGITEADTYTVLVTIPATTTLAAAEAVYDVEFTCMNVAVKTEGFIIQKLFKIKDSKI